MRLGDNERVEFSKDNDGGGVVLSVENRYVVAIARCRKLAYAISLDMRHHGFDPRGLSSCKMGMLALIIMSPVTAYALAIAHLSKKICVQVSKLLHDKI